MFSFLLSLVLLVFPQQADRPSPAELARNVQARYAKVRDFSAEFVHTYEGGVLRRKAEEKGTVLIKKPGKMRWTYREPERKLFVSDGQKLYAHIPADKQVIVSKVANEASTPALFLSGKGDILRDFEVSFPRETPPPDGYLLQLVPKSHEPEYERLLLTVDKKTLALKGLVADDHQGGRSTFSFVNLKENIGISDKEFVFQIPKGVEVVADAR